MGSAHQDIGVFAVFFPLPDIDIGLLANRIYPYFTLFLKQQIDQIGHVEKTFGNIFDRGFAHHINPCIHGNDTIQTPGDL